MRTPGGLEAAREAGAVEALRGLQESAAKAAAESGGVTPAARAASAAADAAARALEALELSAAGSQE